MAHYQQLEFVRRVRDAFPDDFRGRRVLEVGSWDTNGTVRSVFSACDYLGIDVAPGPGVDRVCQGQDLDALGESFDVTISCECFEHNRHWFETFANMIRVLRKGGLCVMSCATSGRPEHGTVRASPGASLTGAGDYYRNLTGGDFERRIDLHAVFSAHFFVTNIYHCDLFFVGRKRGPGDAPGVGAALDALRSAVEAITTEAPLDVRAQIGMRARWYAKLALSRLLGERAYHTLKHHARRSRVG